MPPRANLAPAPVSRALIALSLLGEARSPHGKECLLKFLKRPPPERGTEVEGEILEQAALAVLQAKAVAFHQGLGSPHLYLGPLMNLAAARASASVCAAWLTLAGTQPWG